MSFLIEPAIAEAAGNGQSGGGSVQFLATIVVFTLVFYFIIIRPQSKRQKEQRAMISALNKGDEVVTNGGTLGRITKAGDNFLTLEVAQGVEIKVQRSAVAQVMPKGTIKAV